MDIEIRAALAGLIYNPRAAESFIQRSYDKALFFEESTVSDLTHGDKKAYFLAYCALAYYAKHTALVPWSYVLKILRKRKSSQQRISAYKKTWALVKKKRKIEFGEWCEYMDTVITKYREYRHKDLFWKSAKLHSLTCLGNHGKLDACKECEFWKECQGITGETKINPSVWILDWASAQTEQIKIDTKGTYIKVYQVHELMEEALEQLDKDRKEVDENGNLMAQGIRTPFPLLTKNIGGWRKQRFYMVGSRSGVGKSAFMLQCGDEAASDGEAVIYFNLEMPVKEELIYRILAYICGIQNDNIEFETLMNKLITDAMMKKIRKKAKEWVGSVDGKPLFEIVDASLSTPLPTILRHIDRFKARVGDKRVLAIIDYFNIIYMPPNVKRPDLYMASMAEDIHAFARDRNIAILSALQLNRIADGAKRLTAKHVRDSDKIIDNVDAFWGLMEISPELIRLQNAKARYFRPKDHILKKELWKMGFKQYSSEDNKPLPEDDEDDLEEGFFSG